MKNGPAAAAERFTPLFSPDLPEWAIGPFTNHEGNPILTPVGDGWESGFVYNPSVVEDGRLASVTLRAARNAPREVRVVYEGKTSDVSFRLRRLVTLTPADFK